jgi:chemotaxis protein methyltransferase CheR
VSTGIASDPRAFEFVRRLVYTETGIVIDEGKEYLVEARLGPLARTEGLASIDALVQSLRTGVAPGLQRKVIAAMTTNETTFFRDTEPFRLLEGTVLPALIEARRDVRRLRIWYAACSTGQEPYSVSMLVRESFPELLQWNLHQRATDISDDALERARAGRYTQIEVNRGLPAKLLVKYFEKHGQEWRIHDVITQMVRFEELNLNGPWPPQAKYDVVFIRNVMIYFDVEAKRRILGRMYDLLEPDGFLFLGAAETTFSLDDRFERMDVRGAGCYRPVHKRATA